VVVKVVCISAGLEGLVPFLEGAQSAPSKKGTKPSFPS
jgi:hypothetical protein